MNNHLEVQSENIINEISEYENRELKGFHTKISDDVRELLVLNNVEGRLNNNPELSIFLITSIHSSDPCSSCVENVSNVCQWAEKNFYFENRIRILLQDSSEGFNDMKIWDKLKISFDDVPIALFFNKDFCLIDVVQGTMSVNYLEMFWTPYINS